MRAAVIMWSSLALLPSLMRPYQHLSQVTYLLQKVLGEITSARAGFLLHVPSRCLKFLYSDDKNWLGELTGTLCGLGLPTHHAVVMTHLPLPGSRLFHDYIYYHCVM
jgi:hypothetical protein